MDAAALALAAFLIDPKDVRVIDGDTIVVMEERVRVMGIDAPEADWRAQCDAERALAAHVKTQVELLLSQPFEMSRHGLDKYKRTRGKITLPGGADLGSVLIAQRLAVPWAGKRHDWCG